MTTQPLEPAEGETVYDRNGDKLGKVDAVYADERDRPRFAHVHSGLFGTRRHFVPLAGATRDDRGNVIVAYDRDRVHGSPDVGTADVLSVEEEAELSRYYELDTVTLYAEEAELTTVRQPSEVVRMRKRLVTEMVTMEVPVTREVVELERVPVDSLSEEELREARAEGAEIVEAEEVVVERRDVPVERARMVTDDVIEERTVDVQLDREEIRVDEAQETETRRGV